MISYRKCVLIMATVGFTWAMSYAAQEQAKEQQIVTTSLRPPATPLVACDPYFSVWSTADRLTDNWPTHWTGRAHAMQSMVRVDDKFYRIMGPQPAEVPAMQQITLSVLPTRTIYQFRNEQVIVTLSFLTPQLPQDLEVFSRPVTYLTWQVQSLDRREHDVTIYHDVTAEWVVNELDQKVSWSAVDIPGLNVMRMGSVDQPVLAKAGDDLRIDWGYLYAATPSGKHAAQVVGNADKMRVVFKEGKPLPTEIDTRQPRAARDAWPAICTTLPLGKVGKQVANCHLILAYDDLYSIEYLGTKLRPYWRRNGAEAADLLTAAESDYTRLAKACDKFDSDLMTDLAEVGGSRYAQICALAYRQCNAANKLAAGPKGQPMLFPKENFSNGCIATVDIIYPMDPQYLLLNPALARASLRPVLDYAATDRWRFPFAPHDVGTYPLANGQVYGGGEKTEENQMPVEESGNMLLLMAAVAHVEQRPDFAREYWPILTKWAEYLKAKGLDPEKQLCTDDFAGHLAHNVNLSAKAVLALAAYAQMSEKLGKTSEAAGYRKLAEEYAQRWAEMADDGDHYRLAFDKQGTWSQKYNLIWDRVLGLKLFPAEITRKEIAYYLTKQNRYGLPLDSRDTYTKLDWIVWSASLADSREDFEALVSPVYVFLNETPDRVPMTDWYRTTDAKRVGFQARAVVGGVFIKMLTEPKLWLDWADGK